MTVEHFDELGQLISCYFHQDWMDEFKSYLAAIEAIRTSETEKRIAESRKEIRDLLAGEPSESDLRSILIDQIGCYFQPHSIGLDYRLWLEHLYRVLKDA